MSLINSFSHFTNSVGNDKGNFLLFINPFVGVSNSILAVSYANDKSEVLKSNVAGFVYCKTINSKDKTITFLSPCPGPFPSRYLLLGTVKWFDT